MTTAEADAPGLPTLRSLVNHLEVSGWRVASRDETSSEWIRTDEDLRVVLPGSERLSDYGQLVRAAVRVLAFDQARPERDVLEDIALGGADVVALRFVPDALAGEAPLLLAQSVVNAAKNLIVGAASSLETSALVLPSRRPIRAEAFSGQARVGVEAGSFIFRISLPVGGEWADRVADGGEILDAGMLQSYGRAVTMRVQSAMRAAQSMAQEVRSGRSGIVIFASRGQHSVNATELASLGALGGPEREPYSVRFSKSPLVDGDLTAGLISISAREQDIFTEAAEFLRTRQPRSDVAIQGLVVRLTRNKAFGPGEVVVHSTTDDSEKERSVRVELSEEDYATALLAHGQGLQIRATGDLVIRGTSQALRQVHDFHLVSGLEDG